MHQFWRKIQHSGRWQVFHHGTLHTYVSIQIKIRYKSKSSGDNQAHCLSSYIEHKVLPRTPNQVFSDPKDQAGVHFSWLDTTRNRSSRTGTWCTPRGCSDSFRRGWSSVYRGRCSRAPLCGSDCRYTRSRSSGRSRPHTGTALDSRCTSRGDTRFRDRDTPSLRHCSLT